MTGAQLASVQAEINVLEGCWESSWAGERGREKAGGSRGTPETGPRAPCHWGAFLSLHFCLCIGKTHPPKPLTHQLNDATQQSTGFFLCPISSENDLEENSAWPNLGHDLISDQSLGSTPVTQAWNVCFLSLGARKRATKQKPRVGLRRG